MVRRVMKKLGAILLVAGLTIGFCSPSVSAAVKVNQKSAASAARYVQPEEWNKEELVAYRFDSEEDLAKYLLTGGLHLYNKDYKEKDHWVKVKVLDSGLLYILAVSESDEKITLYDATKKKVISKNLNGSEYLAIANAGDEFYLKLPTKIKKTFVAATALKGEFSSMKDGRSYYEIGKGTSTYHPFSVSKRSEVNIEISTVHKKIGNISANLEKNIKGKWTNIGRTTIKPNSNGEALVYGLSAGKYRLVLKNPEDQIVLVEYGRYTRKKKAAYKKSKAIKINGDVYNIYTTEEQAPRWYKTTVSSVKQKNYIYVSKDTVEGGFKFSIYKKGKKKAIKTIKLGKKQQRFLLPKQKGTYYIKVSKLTKKTNGAYEIEESTY